MATPQREPLVRDSVRTVPVSLPQSSPRSGQAPVWRDLARPARRRVGAKVGSEFTRRRVFMRAEESTRQKAGSGTQVNSSQPRRSAHANTDGKESARTSAFSKLAPVRWRSISATSTTVVSTPGRIPGALTASATNASWRSSPDLCVKAERKLLDASVRLPGQPPSAGAVRRPSNGGRSRPQWSGGPPR